MNRLLGKFLMLSVTLKSLEAVNTKVAVRADGALDLAYSQVVAADAAILEDNSLQLVDSDKGSESTQNRDQDSPAEAKWRTLNKECVLYQGRCVSKYEFYYSLLYTNYSGNDDLPSPSEANDCEWRPLPFESIANVRTSSGCRLSNSLMAKHPTFFTELHKN